MYVYISLGIFVYPAYAVPYRTVPCHAIPMPPTVSLYPMQKDGLKKSFISFITHTTPH